MLKHVNTQVMLKFEPLKMWGTSNFWQKRVNFSNESCLYYENQSQAKTLGLKFQTWRLTYLLGIAILTPIKLASSGPLNFLRILGVEKNMKLCKNAAVRYRMLPVKVYTLILRTCRIRAKLAWKMLANSFRSLPSIDQQCCKPDCSFAPSWGSSVARPYTN